MRIPKPNELFPGRFYLIQWLPYSSLMDPPDCGNRLRTNFFSFFFSTKMMRTNVGIYIVSQQLTANGVKGERLIYTVCPKSSFSFRKRTVDFMKPENNFFQYWNFRKTTIRRTFWGGRIMKTCWASNRYIYPMSFGTWKLFSPRYLEMVHL